MKDKLQELINQNREAFDELEPSPRIWQVIRQKLGFTTLRFQISLPIWFQAAAMLATVSAALLIIFVKVQPRPELPAVVATIEQESELPEEFIEAGIYYGGAMSRYLSEMDKLNADTGEAGKMVYAQLHSLDSAFNDLMRQSMETGWHERVFQALIRNYQMRIELMQSFIENYQQNQANDEPSL